MFYITKEGAIYYNNGLVAQDNNPMHIEYLKWIEEGNEPIEFDIDVINN